MEPVREVRGVAAPLPRADVDTDQIIPKQFLKRVERTGYGDFLFHDWRFLDDGSPDPDFVLNRPPFDRARVLVAGRNFGCGSSREHAVWALADFGFRAVVASSFADIFLGNCFQSGVVPVRLAEADVDRLLAVAERGGEVTVDVEAQIVLAGSGFEASFDLDPFRKRCLLEGLDDIALTLERAPLIAEHERRTGPPSWA